MTFYININHNIYYTISERRYEDDIKSVERAKKELQKIDKQLQVVHSQTETIRKEHIELTQCLKVCQTTCL